MNEPLKGNDLLKEWIKALRSGKYKQCTAKLHNETENSYCCLGVLCKVANIEIDNSIKQVSNNDDNPNEYISDEIIDQLEIDLDKFAVTHYNSNYYNYRDTLLVGQKAFANLNDVKFKNFNEIADFIESQL